MHFFQAVHRLLMGNKKDWVDVSIGEGGGWRVGERKVCRRTEDSERRCRRWTEGRMEEEGAEWRRKRERRRWKKEKLGGRRRDRVEEGGLR